MTTATLAAPRTLRNPYFWAMAALLLVLAIPFCTRRDSEWDGVYVSAATRFLAGQDLYGGADGYVYPPFMAMLACPFTALPPIVSRAIFFAICGACLVWMLRSAWRIAGGRDFAHSASWTRSEHAVLFLGLGCGFCYALHCFAHQQTDVVIAALVLGGAVALQTDRPLRAAAMLGLAAGMKCTALLWLPYLLLRRKWSAAACLLAVAVSVNLLPDLVRAEPAGRTWAGAWASRFLPMFSNRDYVPGTWASDVLFNQSLAGGAHRLVRAAGGGTIVSPLASKGLLLGVELGLMAVATILFLRRPRLDPAATPDEASWAGGEYGVLVILMVLLSPMSSIPHFCTLILPGFWLARRAIVDGSRTAWVCAGLAVLAALFSNKDLVGGRLYTLGLSDGVVTWNAALLLAGIGFAMLETTRASRVARQAESSAPKIAA
jgi:hypothetical protein